MNILYIAFSCQPNKGSEEKIGWNIPLQSSKTNKVFVVTREEQRAKIEEYVKEHKPENIKFYYVDINPFYKWLFKGPMFSLRLNLLHKKAYPLVKQICKNERIDIIHQITPIEFRSIGAYHKISNTRFVCGPLGGGEYIPRGLERYAFSNMHIEIMRRMLNQFYKIKYLINKNLSKCDYFLFANRETQNYMRKMIGDAADELYFDNGISDEEILETKKIQKKTGDKIVFLTAGRMAYRKGHRLLLESVKRLPRNLNCEFRFVGDGPELGKLKGICQKYNLEDRVFFTGKISYSEMRAEYDNADVFIMPSIRETTGSVLLEAASRGVPVIAMDRFGAPVIFDAHSAYFYTGKKVNEYINSLQNLILDCITDPSVICHKGENARIAIRSHTWENKLEKYNAIYRGLLGS